MPIYSTNELLDWIQLRNKAVHVSISKTSLDKCLSWYYDTVSGEIRNLSHSFFQIKGLQIVSPDRVILEQPIIIQDEIGYLGIIRKRINGELHYLMQAKIEPGNINKVQISPTIQATKSNFTKKHGGTQPAYLDYFLNSSKYSVVVDQIQSEQSSRFRCKRNRNIIIEISESEDIEILPSHKWMTLAQIKEIMHYDNLVNMDTRTVLSCLPLEKQLDEFSDITMLRSVQDETDNISQIYQYINNYKMFDETERRLVPLFSLNNWEMRDNEFVCKYPYSFKVVFCDIEIEGREVKHWYQPQFEAVGIATFGLFTRINHGIREFLVRAVPEVGCFDKIELGPSVQREYTYKKGSNTIVDTCFDEHMRTGDGVRFNTLLSEEGGRFYHEQNRNVIIELGQNELLSPPEGYFWTNYRTLGTLIKVNNCLNIQLRNLLSVLKL